jgi:hypothetical protein
MYKQQQLTMACPIKARLTHPRILKAKATGLTLLVVLLVAPTSPL